MGPARRVSATGTLAVLLMAAGAPAAMACSCADLSTAEAGKLADLVASGTVTTVQRGPGSSSGERVFYTLAVDKSFKGEAWQTTTVTSAASGASCGVQGIDEGDDIVLFASESPGGWTTTLCDGTAPASPALLQEVEKALGAGKAPQEGTDPKAARAEGSGESAPRLFGAAAIGFMVAAAVAGVVLARQRRG